MKINNLTIKNKIKFEEIHKYKSLKKCQVSSVEVHKTNKWNNSINNNNKIKMKIIAIFILISKMEIILDKLNQE